ICDFAIRFKDGDKSIRGWRLQEDAQSAGVEYAKYVRAALKTPYIIGAFWCNPIDSTPAFSKAGIKQGLFGEGLKPRPGLGEGISDLNRRIAEIVPELDGMGETVSVIESDVVGNPDFVHLENDKGVWWLASHTGERFITTGMNHVGEGGVLFNEVNDGWLTGRFGNDIRGSWGGLNPRAKNMGAYADMVVKDFKDYGFNTIPFHAYSTPLHLYEKRKIHFVAKIKVQNISLMQMNRANGARFPDVFSESFRARLDEVAKKICTPLRDSKYCLGYAYFDMPDLKPVRRWHSQMFPDRGLVYPWVQDMRELPADAEGKRRWIQILEGNHESAVEAARVYAIDNVETWEELSAVTSWPIKPNDVFKVKKDADDMLTALAEKWYGLHRELIKKHDPNHLLLGDKYDVGYEKSVEMIPDGVLNAIGKHCDVLMIQYYSFYTDQHNATLRDLHSKTGLPIINGDHSYAFKTPKHTKIKGLEVESLEAVANEYRRYMRGIMEDHPYMLGWWNCGYIEQWAPAGTKQLGQQSGFFSPRGEPNTKLLTIVSEANKNAATWHGAASSIDVPPNEDLMPKTPEQLFETLKLTTEQRSKLERLEKQRQAAVATFRDLEGASLQEKQNVFYSDRRNELRKVFTPQQWTIWSKYWNDHKSSQDDSY
ncbi:MAG: hypothetical protein AAF664_05240, partial [Planctomycetota bacterium]